MRKNILNVGILDAVEVKIVQFCRFHVIFFAAIQLFALDYFIFQTAAVFEQSSVIVDDYFAVFAS